MNKRLIVFLRFIVLNVLFFAGYLNFIHQDIVEQRIEPRPAGTSSKMSFSKQSFGKPISLKDYDEAQKNTSSTPSDSKVLQAALYW